VNQQQTQYQQQLQQWQAMQTQQSYQSSYQQPVQQSSSQPSSGNNSTGVGVYNPPGFGPANCGNPIGTGGLGGVCGGQFGLPSTPVQQPNSQAANNFGFYPPSTPTPNTGPRLMESCTMYTGNGYVNRCQNEGR
jgi:hypothetical protein